MSEIITKEITELVKLLSELEKLQIETDSSSTVLEIRLKDGMGGFFKIAEEVDSKINHVFLEHIKKALHDSKSFMQLTIKEIISKKLDAYVYETGADTPW